MNVFELEVLSGVQFSDEREVRHTFQERVAYQVTKHQEFFREHRVAKMLFARATLRNRHDIENAGIHVDKHLLANLPLMLIVMAVADDDLAMMFRLQTDHQTLNPVFKRYLERQYIVVQRDTAYD